MVVQSQKRCNGSLKVHFGHFFEFSQNFRHQTTSTTMVVFRRNFVHVLMVVIGRWIPSPKYSNFLYIQGVPKKVEHF